MMLYLISKFFLESLHLCLLLSTPSPHPGSTCNTKDFTSSFNYQSFSPVFFPNTHQCFSPSFQHLVLSFDPSTTNILTVFLVFYFFLLSHLYLQLYHTSFHSCHSSVFLFSFFFKSFIWCAQN